MTNTGANTKNGAHVWVRNYCGPPDLRAPLTLRQMQLIFRRTCFGYRLERKSPLNRREMGKWAET